MKAIGIVRRIDDLGRIVIPKELRTTMGIDEGDPIEIFTEDGYILLRKYRSPHDAQRHIEALHDLTQMLPAAYGLEGHLEAISTALLKAQKEGYIHA